MKYGHRFRVRAPLAAVASFHADSTSMAAITPPPMIVRVHSAPTTLRSGDEMAFTLWLGPLPVRWHARIENSTMTGFVDRQVQGPFAQWTHRHSFRAVGNGLTEVRDEVQATLRKHVWWRLLGFVMWIGLPLLFAYRGWKTRRLLEKKAP